MRIQFRGWQREVNEHIHEVIPVALRRDRYSPQNKGTLEWHNDKVVYGKIENVALSGSFLVEFRMDPRELESWLTKYAKANPEEALRIIAKAQAEAVISLACGGVQEEAAKDTL